MANARPCRGCRYFEKLAAQGTGACSVRAPESGFVTQVNACGTCSKYEAADGVRVRYKPIGPDTMKRLDDAARVALAALSCGLDAKTATERAKDIATASWLLAKELENQRAAWLKEWSKRHTPD